MREFRASPWQSARQGIAEGPRGDIDFTDGRPLARQGQISCERSPSEAPLSLRDLYHVDVMILFDALQDRLVGGSHGIKRGASVAAAPTATSQRVADTRADGPHSQKKAIESDANDALSIRRDRNFVITICRPNGAPGVRARDTSDQRRTPDGLPELATRRKRRRRASVRSCRFPRSLCPKR